MNSQVVLGAIFELVIGVLTSFGLVRRLRPLFTTNWRELIQQIYRRSSQLIRYLLLLPPVLLVPFWIASLLIPNIKAALAGYLTAALIPTALATLPLLIRLTWQVYAEFVRTTGKGEVGGRPT